MRVALVNETLTGIGVAMVEMDSQKEGKKGREVRSMLS